MHMISARLLAAGLFFLIGGLFLQRWLVAGGGALFTLIGAAWIWAEIQAKKAESKDPD